jgi:hypothetical protein
MRRLSWWKVALWAEGEGWLRWKDLDVETYYWESNAECYAPEWHRVWPPLRRFHDWARWWLIVPRVMLREHLSWEEARPDWSCLRADPDRRKELWHG